MEQSDQSKKVLLSVIGVAILVVAVVGVSFAFFNYTRAGQQNSISTGKIWFGSSQSGAISVSNFFPGDTSPASANATITVHGGTNYTSGMTYRLRVSDLQNYDGSVPILLNVSTVEADPSASPNPKTGVNDTTHGTFTATTPTGGSAGVAIPLSDGAILGTGTITNGGASAVEYWMNGDITVTAYIDSNIAITDTYPAESTDTNSDGYLDGTTTNWLNGRTPVTTAQWNALGTTPVTFRIVVEAIETGGNYVS